MVHGKQMMKNSKYNCDMPISDSSSFVIDHSLFFDLTIYDLRFTIGGSQL
jgi:hypothetical protein